MAMVADILETSGSHRIPFGRRATAGRHSLRSEATTGVRTASDTARPAASIPTTTTTESKRASPTARN